MDLGSPGLYPRRRWGGATRVDRSFRDAALDGSRARPASRRSGIATAPCVVTGGERASGCRDPLGVWCCEPREPSVARAAAAITLKVPTARTRSPPPNPDAFAASRPPLAVIKLRPSAQDYCSRSPRRTGSSGMNCVHLGRRAAPRGFRSEPRAWRQDVRNMDYCIDTRPQRPRVPPSSTALARRNRHWATASTPSAPISARCRARCSCPPGPPRRAPSLAVHGSGSRPPVMCRCRAWDDPRCT